MDAHSGRARCSDTCFFKSLWTKLSMRILVLPVVLYVLLLCNSLALSCVFGGHPMMPAFVCCSLFFSSEEKMYSLVANISCNGPIAH